MKKILTKKMAYTALGGLALTGVVWTGANNIDTIRTNVVALQGVISRMATESDGILSAFNIFRNDVESQINERNQTIADLLNQIEELEKQIEDGELDYTEANELITELRETIRGLQDEILALENTINELENEITTANYEIQALDNEISVILTDSMGMYNNRITIEDFDFSLMSGDIPVIEEDQGEDIPAVEEDQDGEGEYAPDSEEMTQEDDADMVWDNIAVIGFLNENQGNLIERIRPAVQANHSNNNHRTLTLENMRTTMSGIAFEVRSNMNITQGNNPSTLNATRQSIVNQINEMFIEEGIDAHVAPIGANATIINGNAINISLVLNEGILL